jgi:hypothetical protein
VLQFLAVDPPITATVGPDGRMLGADATGRITVLLDDDRLASNPLVVLSAPPASASFAE